MICPHRHHCSQILGSPLGPFELSENFGLPSVTLLKTNYPLSKSFKGTVEDDFPFQVGISPKFPS